MTKQEEREFEKILKGLHCGVCCEDSDYRESGLHSCGGTYLKDFLANLTKKREIKLIEEVERLIEGMKQDACNCACHTITGGWAGTCPCYDIYSKHQLCGTDKTYNKALSDLKENLKKLKGK